MCYLIRLSFYSLRFPFREAVCVWFVDTQGVTLG